MVSPTRASEPVSGAEIRPPAAGGVRTARRDRKAGRRGVLLPSLAAAAMLTAGASALLCGCTNKAAKEHSAPITTDIVDLLPFTESPQDTVFIDFGTELGNRYLASGWSLQPPPSTATPPRSVAYLRQRRGRLFFHIAEPGSRAMALRCAAFAGERPGITAVFRLNGSHLGRRAFTRRMTRASVDLPVAAQRQGRNEIAVWTSTRPAAAAGVSTRPSAARTVLACDAMWIRAGDPSHLSARFLPGTRGMPLLLIPPGEFAEFYLQLRAGDRLALAGLNPSPNGLIRVEESRNGRPRETIYEGTVGANKADLALPGSPGDIAAVRVAAAGRETLRLERFLLQRRVSVPAPPARQDGNPGQRTNVILYVVDTLRADHLGCYGYHEGTSPRIDEFARSAVLFKDAQAQAPWTRPAVASLLTGVLPQRHGAVTLRAALATRMPTLAELLHRHGYATAAFVSNVNVSPQWGFGRGFDRYEYFEEDTKSRRMHQPAGTLHRAGLDWIRTVGPRPFFLYVHATDPHAPYVPEARYRSRFERRELRPPGLRLDRPLQGIQRNKHSGKQPTANDAAWLASLYDAEIAEFDSAFGKFLNALGAAGVLDQTLFVFVADHGEEFLDHGGLAHGKTLYSAQLHTPLIMRFPEAAGAGRRVDSLVSHVDMLPTVLDYLGIPVPGDVDGISLLPDIRGTASGREASVVLSQTSWGRREMSAVIAPGWKVILDQGRNPRHRGRTAPRPEVVGAYNRLTDRRENTHAPVPPYLAQFARQVLAASAGWQDAVLDGEPPPRQAVLTAETQEKLRALGYMGD